MSIRTQSDGIETKAGGSSDILHTSPEPLSEQGSPHPLQLRSIKSAREHHSLYVTFVNQLRRGLGKALIIPRRVLIRISKSPLFGTVWPPYRAMAYQAAPARLAATHVSFLIVRIVERLFGSPAVAAATNAPLPGHSSGRYSADADIVVLACSSLHAGGAERQLAVTARGLRDRGLRPVFVGHDRETPIAAHHYAALLREVGIPTYNAAEESTFLSASDDDLRELGRRCAALPLGIGSLVAQHTTVFRRLRPRVVHSWLDYNNIMAGIAALWAGVPRVVLGLRNVNPTHFPLYQPYFRPLYRLMLTDERVRLVANSIAGARDYADWLAIPHDQIQVIPNAFEGRMHNVSDMNPKYVTAGDRPADTDPLILGVFRFYHEKDPLLFVRTAAAICKRMPRARFKLLGAGPFEMKIRTEAARLGIEHKLELVGVQKNVFDWMRRANLLLHCSRVEGLPNVLLEAQAAGLPIVTTAVGGCPEAIEQGVTGVALHSREPDALACAAVEFLQSPDRLALARSRGPESVSERFGLSQMIDRTLAAYDIG